jgi:hypothetical protein
LGLENIERAPILGNLEAPMIAAIFRRRFFTIDIKMAMRSIFSMTLTTRPNLVAIYVVVGGKSHAKRGSWWE